MSDKLTLINITKTFPHFLLQVSLTIKDREFFSLLGSSGSGKTTLLHIIGGFVTPDSGRILKNEADITRLPPDKRNIGIVFQDYALFPYLTVYENIAFGLKLKKGMSKDEIDRRVVEIAETFGISKILNKYPDMISGGEKQRTALARAMIVKPDVLLMDEPLSSLDAKIREKLMDELKKFHKEFGVTIVYVTHDQNEAMFLSDRIALINNGQIDQISTPLELYEHPKTPFARSFIGKMNALQIQGKAVYVREENVKVGKNGKYQGVIEKILYQGSTAEIFINTDFGTVKAIDFLRNIRYLKIGQNVHFDFEEVLNGNR